jgi:hypothetical protein
VEVQLIECKLIDIPKNDADFRSFNKEFAVTLASSIKVEGLYNAIVIRPNPASPGRWILVQGRHRLYAVMKVLKEQFISANVMMDMDDEDANMAMIAENLWRNPLTKNQHLKAIKRWHEHYVKKHPEMVGKGLAGGAATKKASDDRKAKAEGGESEATNSTEVATAEEPTTGFAEMVSGATGKSSATAKRDIKVAKSFNDEQLEVFEQMSVSSKDMLTIAKIKDDEKKNHIVNLVAAGMEPEEAIKEIMKDEAPAAYNGPKKEEAEAKAAAKTEKQADLTDDEWFDTFCGEKAAMFKDSAKYRADAILFRQAIEPRHTFRSKIKKSVADTKKGNVLGLFYFLMNRVISISHPKDWLICECKGQGEITNDRGNVVKCPKCNGGGYALKVEQYL